MSGEGSFVIAGGVAVRASEAARTPASDPAAAGGHLVELAGEGPWSVRCDGTVQVERFDQLVCQAPDVKVALTFIQELMADSPSKRKIEEEEEESSIKKSPKMEEQVSSTPPLNLE